MNTVMSSMQKSLKAPENLRPVLKPSASLVPATVDVKQVDPPVKTDSPKRKYSPRRTVLKNMKHLTEKYGENFRLVHLAVSKTFLNVLLILKTVPSTCPPCGFGP